jgi:hypothetical protein
MTVAKHTIELSSDDEAEVLCVMFILGLAIATNNPHTPRAFVLALETLFENKTASLELGDKILALSSTVREDAKGAEQKTKQTDAQIVEELLKEIEDGR